MAGKINYIAPVDTVSGMFGKRDHSLSGKAIISNVRMKPSQKNPRGLMYFSVLTKTTYKGSSTQTSWQALFAQACNDTRARLKNPTYVDDDLVAFRSQTKYKTLYAYVFNIVLDGIKEGK